MSRLVKVLFALSFVLAVLSYPTCQHGERAVQSEMAKYPPEFVSEHYFDWMFLRFVAPGVGMFFMAQALAACAIIVWLVERQSRKASRKSG